MRKIRRLGGQQDLDPLHGVANFFDLGVIFALGFLLAVMAYFKMPQLLEKEAEQNSKSPQLEAVRKDSVKLNRYRVTTQTLNGEGVRLGTAYRLKTGEVVYVPEGGDSNKPKSDVFQQP